MDKERYKQDLQEAQKRLIEKLSQRERLDREIAQLRQDIGSLSQLAGEPATLAENAESALAASGMIGLANVSLTEYCREVLKAADGPLTAADIYDGLERLGYPIKHSNILASIHTTVRRMPDIEETEKDEKKAYQLAKSPLVAHIEKASRAMRDAAGPMFKVDADLKQTMKRMSDSIDKATSIMQPKRKK